MSIQLTESQCLHNCRARNFDTHNKHKCVALHQLTVRGLKSYITHISLFCVFYFIFHLTVDTHCDYKPVFGCNSTRYTLIFGPNIY